MIQPHPSDLVPAGRNTCLQRIMSRPVDANTRFPDLLVDSEEVRLQVFAWDLGSRASGVQRGRGF